MLAQPAREKRFVLGSSPQYLSSQGSVCLLCRVEYHAVPVALRGRCYHYSHGLGHLAIQGSGVLRQRELDE